jgi:SAM-dependent methyltransferase
MFTPTADEIHAAVSRSYGDRVRPVLEMASSEAADVTAASCCGPDCCGTSVADDTIQLREVMPVAQDAACCDTSCCGDAVTDDAGTQIANIARLYAEEEVADLPSTVTDVAFGCGNPTAISALQPGETVVDLGSGGGIDVFLAAKMVGPEGRVYGVDMTPEMIELARRNAGKVGATNVEFRHGQIEALPLEDASVDVVISNCVINLSPDKDAVFREAFRVLRPGGRLQVSDIVWTKPVPDEVRHDLEQWAGCVAGALLEREYLEKITAAGFTGVTSIARGHGGDRGIASADVVGFKPLTG